jgi:hypothetical protein
MDKNVQKFIINGKEYQSLEELPEGLRKLFLDENQNGIPDFFEGGAKFDLRTLLQNIAQAQKLPPETKEKILQRLAQLKNLPFPPNRSETSIVSTTQVLSPSPSPSSDPPYKDPTRPSSGSFYLIWTVLIGLLITILAGGLFVSYWMGKK